MISGEYAAAAKRCYTRVRCCLKLLPLGLLLPASDAAAAGASVDCATLSLIRYKVALPAGASALRAIDMKQGDTVAFTFRADRGATGVLTVVAAAGSERELLRGASGAKATFTADVPGPVEFRLATSGGRPGSFAATCRPSHPQGIDLPEEAAEGVPDLDLSVPWPAGAPAASAKSAAAPAQGAVKKPSTDVALEWVGGQAKEPAAATDTLGVKLKLQPAILVGFLAQFDPAADPLLGPGALSDKSWMAGPTTSIQLAPGLALDARAAWGPVGADQSAIDHAGDRQLLDARLGGSQTFGQWRFSPSAGVSYMQERHDTAAMQQPSGGVAVESGRVDVRPEMAYRIDMGHSMFIEPKVMVGAFWNLTGPAAPGADAQAHVDLRHMAETGITFGTEQGGKLHLGGSVEEGDALADDVWRGKLQVNIPLN